MPVIKVDNHQYALRPGPNRVGVGDDVDAPLMHGDKSDVAGHEHEVPAGTVAEPASSVAPDLRPVLATLEVTSSGSFRGRAYEIHVPLAHVGRGSHNDIVIQDDSVSETHAKLQRRDDGWYVVDAGSTNGTYVDGHRLSAERRLEGGLEMRFGGVKAIFRGPSVEGRTEIPESAPAPSANEPSAQGFPMWVWIVVALSIAGAAALFALNR
jgi:hypothetical protein